MYNYKVMHSRIVLQLLLLHINIIHLRISDTHTYSFQSLILCCQSVYIYNSASYHCPIDLSSGSESEGRGEVCQSHSSIDVSDAYSGLEIKNSTVNGHKIIAILHLICRCGVWPKPECIAGQEWFNYPLKASPLGHCAGVGHQLSRTGTPAIHTGGQGGYSELQDTIIHTVQQQIHMEHN